MYDGDGQSWCKPSQATKIIMLRKREYEIHILTCIYNNACKNGELRAYSFKGDALVQTGSVSDHPPGRKTRDYARLLFYPGMSQSFGDRKGWIGRVWRCIITVRIATHTSGSAARVLAKFIQSRLAGLCGRCIYSGPSAPNIYGVLLCLVLQKIDF